MQDGRTEKLHINGKDKHYFMTVNTNLVHDNRMFTILNGGNGDLLLLGGIDDLVPLQSIRIHLITLKWISESFPAMGASNDTRLPPSWMK